MQAGALGEDGLVDGDGLGQRGGTFFKLYGVEEHLLELGGDLGGGERLVRCPAAGDLELASVDGGEVEGKLVGERVDERSAMAEDEPAAASHGTRFDQRVAHAGDLLHGVELAADATGGDALVFDFA